MAGTPKLMLVDGSDATRRMVERLLAKRVSDVHIESSPSAGQALARLAEERFDLISTALVLPDEDGLSFVRAVRALGNHHWTPIIVVSGDADRRSHEEGYAAGVTAFFDKAEGLNALVEFIHTYLDRVGRPVARVLYVEDSPTAAMQVRQTLELDNLDVVHLMSAEEALEVLKRSGIHPPEGFDILVTDILLKGRMSGSDLVRTIRHELGYSPQEFPALLVTVEGSTEDEYQRLLSSGGNAIVTKPLDIKAFLAQINTLVSTRRRHEALHRTAVSGASSR